MVQPREGRGIISSPCLIDAFGHQKPLNMGRCDLYWIIIFFVINHEAFKVENV